MSAHSYLSKEMHSQYTPGHVLFSLEKPFYPFVKCICSVVHCSSTQTEGNLHPLFYLWPSDRGPINSMLGTQLCIYTATIWSVKICTIPMSFQCPRVKNSLVVNQSILATCKQSGSSPLIRGSLFHWEKLLNCVYKVYIKISSTQAFGCYEDISVRIRWVPCWLLSTSPATGSHLSTECRSQPRSISSCSRLEMQDCQIRMWDVELIDVECRLEHLCAMTTHVVLVHCFLHLLRRPEVF